MFCIAALLAGPISAQFHSNMHESAENWLKKSDLRSGNDTQGGNRAGDETPVGEVSVSTPVGNGLYLILLSAGIYAVVLFSKSREYTYKSVLR
jgi:hypothetical protein